MEQGIGWLGEVFECACCGGKAVRYHRQKKFCDDCIREKERIQARERERKKQEAARRDKLALGSSAAIGKPKWSRAEMEAAARKHGMTYGRYSVALMYGQVDPPEPLPAKKPGRKRTGRF